VDRLEEERLVRRLPHPTDRRATVIELTDEGGRTMGTLYDKHRGAVAELFVGLSEGDRRELPREGLRGEGGSC
jgi:MarR family 2-MHQ and catechol resistance regulon transcriptional repressor